MHIVAVLLCQTTHTTCNFKAQKEGFDFDNAEDFDVVGEYLTLNKDCQTNIRNFFAKVDEISLPKDAFC